MLGAEIEVKSERRIDEAALQSLSQPATSGSDFKRAKPWRTPWRPFRLSESPTMTRQRTQRLKEQRPPNTNNEGITGLDFYNIFIHQFVDILANLDSGYSIREWHSLFHVNRASRITFLSSRSLIAKREQFEFAKTLEGLSPSCEIAVHSEQKDNTYFIKFEPPQGVILHFRSIYCKLISPEDVGNVFNAMMGTGKPVKNNPICTLDDFRHIWNLVQRKVEKWPDVYVCHHRHMGGNHSIRLGSDESDAVYARMGYHDEMDAPDPQSIEGKTRSYIKDTLTRVENWRRREARRCKTRLAVIGRARKRKFEEAMMEERELHGTIGEEVELDESAQKRKREGRELSSCMVIASRRSSTRLSARLLNGG
jgi:hypothetical protein